MCLPKNGSILNYDLFVEIAYVVLFVRFELFENLNAVKLQIIVDNSSIIVHVQVYICMCT